MTHSTLHEMQYNDAVAGLIPLVPLVALKRGGGKRTMGSFPAVRLTVHASERLELDLANNWT